MSAGFRKSFLGFNCEDVISYIEKSQKSFAEREKTLSEQITQLSDELELAGDKYKALEAEKNSIAARLKEFNEKYEEIDRLSENIGRLYLVAQANARAVMESSERNAELVERQVEKNLSAITNAHSALDELKERIVKTADEFAAEVDELTSSLTAAREEIGSNTEAVLNSKNQFDEVYSSLTAVTEA